MLGHQFSQNLVLGLELLLQIGNSLLVSGVLGERIFHFQLNRNKIWSRMGAEDDALLLLNDKGIPIAHAGLVMTLRDLARFGLLFTPSTGGVLPRNLLDRLSGGGRPALLGPYSHGDHASYQWDVITAAGEMVKGGFGDQLLYMDTKRDVVIAYFGTNSRVDSMTTRLPLRKMVAQYF